MAEDTPPRGPAGTRGAPSHRTLRQQRPGLPRGLMGHLHLCLNPGAWPCPSVAPALTWVRPLQKRVNTSFMLPPFCMEMTRRWSSSLIHTRKVLLSLCLGEGYSQAASLDKGLGTYPGTKPLEEPRAGALPKSLRCSPQLALGPRVCYHDSRPINTLRTHRAPQRGHTKP